MNNGIQLVRMWVKRGSDWVTSLPNWITWFVFVVVLINVFCYVLVTSDPLVVQDAWYFLDVFIRPALHNSLTVTDFFVRRGGLDHAQPLKKLILLVELRYFHLDLRIQAMVGVVCAGVSLLILRWLCRTNEEGLQGMHAWFWIMMCPTLLSLNSSGVWTWPLVAGGFTTYLILYGLIATLWMMTTRQCMWPIMVLAVIFDVVSNDISLVGMIAMLLALGWLILRRSELRAGAVYAMLVLVSIFIVVRIGYHVLLPTGAGGQLHVEERLQSLGGDFVHGGWWEWAIIPLASSVAFTVPLRGFVGDRALDIQVAIGILLVLAHVWFWWRAFVGRVDRASFSGIILMLVFYALLAGIIFGRIPEFGNGYLNQPRYVAIYSLGNIALLLMACSSWAGWSVSVTMGLPYRVGGMAIAMLAILALAWQLGVSRHAWRASPWISRYYQHMATQISQMGRDPGVTPHSCASELPLCGYSPERRAELIGLLQKHKLNLYSKTFQRTNRLYPWSVAPPADVHRTIR